MSIPDIPYVYYIYAFMAGWAIWSAILIGKLILKKNLTAVNTHFYGAIPTVFTSMGVLGTFIGIYFGLQDFETTNIDGSIETLLEGLKTAFTTSIAGIVCAIFFGRVADYAYGRAESNSNSEASDELSALQALLAAVKEDTHRSEEHSLMLNQSLVGESDASLATQLIKIRNKFTDLETLQGQQTDAVWEIRDALGGDDETSLLSQIQRLRAEQKSAADDTVRSVASIREYMAMNADLLERKFEEFADLLAKSNTEALVDVMRSATEEFNKQMSAIVERLVQENFQELNNSVQAMNQWQKENKAMIAMLTDQFKTVQEDITVSAQAMQRITVNAEKLVAADGVLYSLIDQLKAVMIDDVRFQEVSTKLLGAADLLKENTEAFDQTTNKLNDWIQKEHNFRDAVAALVARLEDFQKIKGYSEEFWDQTRKQMNEGVALINGTTRELDSNLNNISETFNQQLSDTLVSLDHLIRRHLEQANGVRA